MRDFSASCTHFEPKRDDGLRGGAAMGRAMYSLEAGRLSSASAAGLRRREAGDTVTGPSQ